MAAIEAIALAEAGLTPARAAGGSERRGHGTGARCGSPLMVSVAQPEVVATTIQGAKTAKGHRDREHLFKATGLLSTPKGSRIAVNLKGAFDEKDEDGSDDGTGSLPTMDSFLLEIHRAINPRKTRFASVLKIGDDDFTELQAGRLE